MHSMHPRKTVYETKGIVIPKVNIPAPPHSRAASSLYARMRQGKTWWFLQKRASTSVFYRKGTRNEQRSLGIRSHHVMPSTTLACTDLK